MDLIKAAFGSLFMRPVESDQPVGESSLRDLRSAFRILLLTSGAVLMHDLISCDKVCTILSLVALSLVALPFIMVC